MKFALSAYNAAISLLSALISFRNRISPKEPSSKFAKFIYNQRSCLEQTFNLNKNYDSQSNSSKTIWIHASSLGEYQIFRPIIPLLKDKGHRIVLTFFSPTGLDAMKNRAGTKNCPDFILPLPLDTRRNAHNFLDNIDPDIAIFLVSDFWPNYLTALKQRNIPTILYSAFVNRNILNKRFSFRIAMMRMFDSIIVHDKSSKEILEKKGFSNVIEFPDPLFENALNRMNEDYRNDIIEQFCNNQNVLIAGSIHRDKDLDLIASIARQYPDTRIMIVPHEISEDALNHIKSEFPGDSAIYSELIGKEDIRDIRYLIIDFMGALANLYRFGKAAYIGGGFTRFLHSLPEALVYGIPIAFGPNTSRKYLPDILIGCGIGTLVGNSNDICAWWDNIEQGKTDLRNIRITSQYIVKQIGGNPESTLALIESHWNKNQ